MMVQRRQPLVPILVVLAAGVAAWLSPSVTHAQQGATTGLPASAVIARGASDGWHSQGGVVGPWWSGGGAGAAPHAAGGGFWFGWPGLGFGGSQGSARGMNSVAPGVTTTSGGAGMMSSSRLVPFVTGVVPVVGHGFPQAPVTGGPVLPWAPTPSSLPRPRAGMAAGQSLPGGGGGGAIAPRPSPPGARQRARRLMAAGDLALREGRDGPVAARAALVEYRAAGRFDQEDADIQIRQAIVHQALGQGRDADRAIARATRIDGRLGNPFQTVPPDAAGFLAPPAAGTPLLAVRGRAILEEIAAGAERAEAAAEPQGRPPAITWLEQAWLGRWGGSRAPPVAPARGPSP